jgi:hypothetical protein
VGEVGASSDGVVFLVGFLRQSLYLVMHPHHFFVWSYLFELVALHGRWW